MGQARYHNNAALSLLTSSSIPLTRLLRGLRLSVKYVLPVVLDHEVYVGLGRDAKRELGLPILVGYSKIPSGNDIHTDQHISSSKVTLRDADAGEAYVVGQPDTDQECRHILDHAISMIGLWLN